MTFNQFHNALRVLLNIDADEFLAACHPDVPVVDIDNPAHYAVYQDWCAFSNNPYMWFIRASDADAKAIWAIIEKRNEK